mmetsp:Transcript_63012/g.137646  ORF Transcript_63012/g.137646 Transcript_63012/m.137646 type:complete len:382 (+) Transcript_63012:62-1207(+)
MSLRVIDSNDETLCKLEVDAGITACQLKMLIAERTQITRHQQRLCYGLLELADDEPVYLTIYDEGPGMPEILLLRVTDDWASWHEKLEKDGMSLRDAPLEIRSDRKLILVATLQNPAAATSAHEEVWQDAQFVRDAVQEVPEVLKYIYPKLPRELSLLALQMIRARDLAIGRRIAFYLVEDFPEVSEEVQASSSRECASGDAFTLSTIGAGVSASALAGFAAGPVFEGAFAASAALESASTLGAASALVGGTSVALSSVMGAIALPLLGGYTINQLIPGIASASFTLKRGKCRGCCSLQDASVAVATEEGWGNVLVYYFHNESAAQDWTANWSCARILHDCSRFLMRSGPLEELSCAGPAWPRSTIRKAIAELNCFRPLAQ